MLRTRLTLRPGQPGTRKLVEEYGPRVVCIRYRYDDANKKRYKTVELIVEEVDWLPRARRPAVTDLVHIRLQYNELALRESVKLMGGTWHPTTRTWRLAYGAVVVLRLTDRLVTLPSTGDETQKVSGG
ncbi:MAG TPA: hypothetical protein VF787_13400 [Thermoanaerobaculia bacterium]